MSDYWLSEVQGFILVFRKDKLALEREYKRKKNQKKAQRQKQLEEEREQEKNKWLDFNAKVYRIQSRIHYPLK